MISQSILCVCVCVLTLRLFFFFWKEEGYILPASVWLQSSWKEEGRPSWKQVEWATATTFGSVPSEESTEEKIKKRSENPALRPSKPILVWHHIVAWQLSCWAVWWAPDFFKTSRTYKKDWPIFLLALGFFFKSKVVVVGWAGPGLV